MTTGTTLCEFQSTPFYVIYVPIPVDIPQNATPSPVKKKGCVCRSLPFVRKQFRRQNSDEMNGELQTTNYPEIINIYTYSGGKETNQPIFLPFIFRNLIFAA